MGELQGQVNVTGPWGLSAQGEERLTDFSISGKSLLIAHRPTGTGQRVIAMALQTRSQRQSAAGGEVALPAHYASDSAEVVATVHAFHAAIARGDSAAALSMLAPDLTVLESGVVERFADYREHHLPEDIAFARAVPSVTGPLRVTLSGQTAWVVATSTTKGSFNGRVINSSGAELMVLTKGTSTKWLIRAIHWSSRRGR